MLKCEFHVIFMCLKIWFFGIVSTHLRMYKTILSLWVGQKLAEDWIWPVGQNLPTPALFHCSYPYSLNPPAWMPLAPAPTQGLQYSNAPLR